MSKGKYLSVEEESRLARRWLFLKDEKALSQLITSQLGLVVRVAMEFRKSGPPLEDLIQEGNLGLTVAARRFNPERGTRLSTYAVWWIRACILEHVVRSHGPVRIGTTRATRKIFFGLGKVRRQLERETGTVDTQVLAERLGVEQEDLEAMLPRLTGRDISLDAPRSFDDRRSIGSTLAEDAPTPEELLVEATSDVDEREELKNRLKLLDPREKAIINARYLRKTPATLAALGEKLGISRERVRQLELRAKRKLGVPQLQ